MKRTLFAMLIATATLGAAGSAMAQTVYRIVGPDGKISFSDKPPASPEQGKVSSTGVGAQGAASGAALPYELRQVANKYPVTLYSANGCSPCNNGRALLQSRGIPFVERTANTDQDLAALQRINGDSALPVLTVGSQKLRGLSEPEWEQYLDAAGYPKTSVLPSGYRNAPPTALVAVQAPTQAAPAKPAEVAPANTPAAPARGPTASNPAGIQF